MNKRKIIRPLLGFFALVISSVFIRETTPTKTNAAFMENVTINEDFNVRQINEDYWDNSGAELVADETSMRFTPNEYLWTNHLLLTNYTINESVEIDIDLSTSTPSGWFAFSFGSPYEASRFPDAKAALIFYHMLPGNIVGGILERSNNGALYGAEQLKNSPFRSVDEHKTLKMFVELFPETNESKLYFDIYNEDGSVFYSHDEDVYSFDVLLSGHFGMNTDFKNVNLYSFEMKKMSDGEVIYSDDFSTSEISYLSSGDGVWKTNSFTKDEVIISPQGKVGFCGNSSLTLKSPIRNPLNMDIDVVYKITFDIDYAQMDFSSIVGVEIGKENKSSNNAFVGLRRNAIGYSFVALDKDGNVLVEESTSHDEFITSVALKVHNSGLVEFFNSTIGLSFEADEIFGYISLSSKSDDATNTKLAFIDNFVLETGSYINRAAKDVAINFNGTKDEEFFGDIIKDFYVPTSEWRMTPDISLPNYRDDYEGEEEQNGYIQFNSSNGQTFFGSKNTYYEYIVKFDIEIITSVSNLNNTCGFGLQVGMQKFGGYFENYQCLSLSIARNDELDVTRSKIEAQNGTFVDPAFDPYCKDDDNNDINLFAPDSEGNNAKFNVIYVVRDNKVSMYFKNQNEPEEVLSKPRAEMIVKGNTDGYCGIVGREGLTFRVDNYSVTNLDFDTPDSDYLPFKKDNVEYQNKTRLDFSKISNTQALKLNGASIDGALSISNGGEVTTAGVLNNGVLRLNIKKIESKMTLSFGKVNITLNNTDYEKEMVFSDEINEFKKELNQSFSFDNSFIEIQKSGEDYTVIYCGGGEPLSSINDTLTTYHLSAGDGYHELVISSEGSSKISKMTFINMDSFSTIKTRNYDPEKDDNTSWTERPTEEEANGIVEKKTNYLPLILGTSIPLGVALIFTIVFVILMIRRRKLA